MEIKELEPHLKDVQDELIEQQEKTEQFKNNVQDIFIDVFNQDEFTQKVDSIFNEIFKVNYNESSRSSRC
jgi:hypothetical protein